MNFRSHRAAAAVVAAAALLATPGSAPAEAIRNPVRPGPDVFASDPWRPDVFLPPSIVAVRDQKAVDDPAAARQPAARPESWFESLVRFLRSFLAGGRAR